MTPALESWFVRKPFKDARGWREGVYQAVGLPHETQWNGGGMFVCRTWVSKWRCSSERIRMQFSMWLYVLYECSPIFLHYCSLFPKLLASQSSSSIRIWALWVTCGLSSSFVGYSLVTDGDSLKFVNICKLVTLAFPQVMRNHMAGNFVSVFKGCFFKQVAVCKQ